MSGRLVLAAFWAALLCTAAHGADPGYTIKLDRPLKVGQVFEARFVLDSSTKTVTTEPGAAPKTKEVSIKGDANGRLEITEADTAGNPIGMTLLVRRFVTGADNKEAVPGGKTLEIRRTDREVKVTIRNGGDVGDEARQVIAQCLGSIDRTNGMSDDAAQGSAKARKVGDTWKAKGDGAVPQDLVMEAKNMTSDMLFKSVETVNSTPAMRLAWTIQMKDFKYKLQPDYVLDHSNSKIEVTSVVPVDASLPQLELSSLAQTDYAAHHSTGGSTVAITQRISTRQTMTPVKP